MNEVETRDLVYNEVRRYVSPKTYTILVALNIILMIFAFLLYDQNQRLQAWVDVLSGDVKALKSANQLTGEIGRNRDIMQEIATHLGVNEEQEE